MEQAFVEVHFQEHFRAVVNRLALLLPLRDIFEVVQEVRTLVNFFRLFYRLHFNDISLVALPAIFVFCLLVRVWRLILLGLGFLLLSQLLFLELKARLRDQRVVVIEVAGGIEEA